MSAYPGFLGPSNPNQSFLADRERTINLYPEQIGGAAEGGVLLPCPGFTSRIAFAQAPSRAIWNEAGRIFTVAGYALYEVTITAGVYASILRGTLMSNSNPATICSNGKAGHQLFITSGDFGYILDLLTNVLTIVLTSGATMGAYLDGRFLALDATTSTLKASNLLDGLTWDPTMVAQRSNAPDPWRALYVVNRLIYLLGEDTSEVWWDAGTSPFPFAPIQEAFMEEGIQAPFSGAAMGNSLIWLAHNKQGHGNVVRTQGYVPGRISTHAVEFAIQHYTLSSDAVADCYLSNGHPFYVLTLPTGDATWVYDGLTSLWHERAYWNTTTGEYHAYRPMWFVALSDQNLAGDRVTGTIYTMDVTIQTDVDGSLIRRLRQPPRLALDQKRFTVNRFQLVMDVGLGVATGQGSDPQVMLQNSRDGGQTWSNEHWRSAGAQGNFSTQVFWNALGQYRNYTPRVVMTDPVPWRIVDAQITVTPGLS